ncbi:MAG TPA: membrane dipeptidase [Bacteroidetes bacterium]|nr:membrane dipeptidase [Bacteroidota bacterium]
MRLFQLFFIFVFIFSLVYSSDYKKLHQQSIVVDTHNDVLLRALRGEDLSVRTTDGHSDIVRLKEGGVDVQIFSVWCGGNFGKGRAFNRAIEMIDTLNAIVRRSSDKIVFATTYKEIEKIIKQRKMVALIGVEGGHMIEDSLSYLDSLAKRGMNYLTLTWNNSPSWATSAADETEKKNSLSFKGLTEFGKRVVNRLNTLGVMVDLSHVGEQTFWDVIALTKKPVIVSHSSVYSICPSSRNLKDDQIKAVAKNKGVICVNFYSGFIDSNYSTRVREIKKINASLVDSINQLNPDEWKAEGLIDSALAPQYRNARPPLSVLIDHIDYIAKLVGPDYVGIGSDFDGIESLPQDMDDVTSLPNITRELLKRGYKEKDVKKILGGNVMRVLKANMK